MALVTNIERTLKERQTVHGNTRCLCSVFSDQEHNRYLQLDTMGSDERQFTEKVSQSIQFNERSAAQLKKLIDETFPNLS